MRILHVATGQGGGAAIAATRLFRAQADEGFEVALLTSSDRNTFVSSISKLTTASQRLWQKEPYDISTFSNPGQILGKINAISPDLVHIHNWYNLLSLNELKQMGKSIPLIFTLHDQRIMTGGCHLTFDCTRFHKSCEKCPAVRCASGLVKRNLGKLHDVLITTSRLGLVTPSHWMKNQFSLSSQSQGLPIPTVIPNIIETSDPTINPWRKNESSRLRCGFISAQLNTPLKGISNLIQAIEEFEPVNNQLKPLLITAGQGALEIANSIEVINLGRLEKEQMSTFWSQIDVLVVPSLIENFPNVIGEAASHGIPVIASKVGGIPEMLTHGVNGILCPPTLSGLITALKNFSRMTKQERLEMGAKNRAYFDHNLALTRIVGLHKKEYEKVLN